MFKTVLAACAVLCTLSVNASAGCVETGTVMRPVCMNNNFLAGVRSINVTLKRDRRAREAAPARRAVKAARRPVSSFGVSAPSLGYSIARPARYITGRLVCALNVNAALAERGISGTGSAWAKSFLQWGRASAPVPGAVAVSHRRGGGHVAIVKEVRGDGTIIVWNPSPRGRGWQEAVYRHRAIGFRVPG